MNGPGRSYANDAKSPNPPNPPTELSRPIYMSSQDMVPTESPCPRGHTRRTRRDLSPLKGERLSAEARLFRNPPGNFPLNPGCLRSRDAGKTYGPWRFMFHSPPHSWVEHHPLNISLKTRGTNFSWLSWFFEK